MSKRIFILLALSAILYHSVKSEGVLRCYICTSENNQKCADGPFEEFEGECGGETTEPTTEDPGPTTPGPEEPTTAPEEPTTAAPEEPTTAPEEPTTAAPEEPTTAAPEEPTTAPEEPTTAPEEPTIAPEEPTTAPEEPTTAPEEPTTAPEEPTTAAPEEPTTAAPEEPTTAPEEPTTAPEEPTTAPEEPTIAPEVPPIVPQGEVNIHPHILKSPYIRQRRSIQRETTNNYRCFAYTENNVVHRGCTTEPEEKCSPEERSPCRTCGYDLCNSGRSLSISLAVLFIGSLLFLAR